MDNLAGIRDRRAYSIDVAMEILIDAEAKFPKEATIPYNLRVILPTWRNGNRQTLSERSF